MLGPRNIQALPAVAERVLGIMRGTSPRGCGVAWPGPGHGYVEMPPDMSAPTLVGVGSDNDLAQVSDM